MAVKQLPIRYFDCPYCGALFVTGAPRAFHCKQIECLRAYNRDRARLFMERYRTQTGTYYQRRYNETRKQSQYKRTPARVAAEQRRRAQKKQTELIEIFTSEEIFERDGWRCGICEKKVRQTLKYPHPMSPSLDHVVPLADGGAHTKANVRCAHLRCNVARGTRGGGEQLRMIG